MQECAHCGIAILNFKYNNEKCIHKPVTYLCLKSCKQGETG